MQHIERSETLEVTRRPNTVVHRSMTYWVFPASQTKTPWDAGQNTTKALWTTLAVHHVRSSMMLRIPHWITESGDLCTADWAAWPAGVPACICKLHAAAVRLTALVSDEKCIRDVYTQRCAIQIDNLCLFYLLPDDSIPDDAPSLDEVQRTIRRLRDGRAMGADDIPCFAERWTISWIVSVVKSASKLASSLSWTLTTLTTLLCLLTRRKASAPLLQQWMKKLPSLVFGSLGPRQSCRILVQHWCHHQ